MISVDFGVERLGAIAARLDKLRGRSSPRHDFRVI